MGERRRRLRGRSIAARLLVLQVVVVLVTSAVGGAFSVLVARDRADDRHAARGLAIAETLAEEPEVRDALGAPDPSATLQPLAEDVRRRTGVAFVVVMSPEGVRFTHPTRANIGRRFVGAIAGARRGGREIETRRGTLGRSVRAVVPVRDARGRVIGLVGVGVLSTAVAAEVRAQVPLLLGLTSLALGLGVLLSLLVARRLRRQTLGLEPAEVARLYEHQQAVLHAILEGVLVVGDDGRLLLANDGARELLGLADGSVGRPVRDVVGDERSRALLLGRGDARDELLVVGGRVLVANRRSAAVRGRGVGTVTTLRDRTELLALHDELDAVRGMARSLREQAHEQANELHAVVGMVELGEADAAVAFATERAAAAQGLLGALGDRVSEPALVALLVGKAAEARARGLVLDVDPTSRLIRTDLPAPELVTLVGNLVDNALDAVGEAGPPAARVTVAMHDDADGTRLVVDDDGPGFAGAIRDRALQPGVSTKAEHGAHGQGLGLALVDQLAARHGGRVEVGDGPAGGARVRVLLPPAPAPAARPGPPEVAATPVGSRP